MRVAVVLLGVLLGVAPGTCDAAASVALAAALEGRTVQQLTAPGTRVVLLFFAATDCPLSNRYVPEIEAIAAHEASALAVRWVYPNSADSAAMIEAHRKQYAITVPALRDTRGTLTRLAHATVTPEAALLVPDKQAASGWRVVYAGRVDDRYATLGRERPQATQHDLAAALRAALAGQPVPGPGGPPVGCAIVGR